MRRTVAKQVRRSSIAAMAVNLPLNADDPTKLLPLSDKGTKVYNYHYDQLNRLVAMDAFGGLNTATHTFSPVLLNDYQERVTYDPNGNILTYNRNGNQAANEAMDRLVYTYGTANNQLNTLVDNASDGTYTTDIKAPTASPINYSYDQIGNITQDGSNAISWTVYGKIANQTGAGGTISYLYDAASNRISKTTSTGTTLYVRDPQGNVLATYQRGTSGAFAQSEIELYGSSRLGMTKAPALPSQTINLSGGGTANITSFTRGLKSYELTNRLGNVLATITDRKIGVSSDGSLTISSYNADIATVQDYYPFGMQMPGRTFTATGSGSYRYGYNGKENNNEVKGVGNQIDYGMRVYDPRAARFMSVDLLTKKYPELTPYQYASNTPIQAIDLDGLEAQDQNATSALYISNLFRPKSQQLTQQQIEEQGAAYNIGTRNGLLIGWGVSIDWSTGGNVTKFLVAQELIGAFPHRAASTQAGRALQDENSKKALADAFVFWSTGQIFGSAIRFFKGPAQETYYYLFRGTNEGFAGSRATLLSGVTPTSTDPVVSTLYAILGKNYGKGVLQIVLPEWLQGVEYAGGNVLGSLEHEVGLTITPQELSNKAYKTITADQARGVLKSMGIDLPSRVYTEQGMNEVIKRTPRLTKDQTDEFVKRVLKLGEK